MKIRIFIYIIIALAVKALILLLLWTWFLSVIRIDPPEVVNRFGPEDTKQIINKNFYVFEDSWLKRNEFGLWEMYITGNAFERGYKKGILTDSLMVYQEEVFVNSIREFVPSDFYLNILKYFVSFFNRKLDEHVLPEFLEEIYGVSLFASEEFNFIGTPYQRMLNYHAAHDIGHALQNMDLVACTAFELRHERTVDSTVIIGRNMDFSSGDDFAENKIIAFYKPANGYNFCFITWAGMIGVVSGMNEKGLVIALNAAKSGIPSSAKTPVSIMAREVLQYASNIEEAYDIIKNKDVFVAEMFLVSSIKDNKTVVIEKSIDDIGIYYTGTSELILTNHFQSEQLRNTELNIRSIEEGATEYRHRRVKELLDRNEKHCIKTVAKVLRDQQGLNDTDIGMGNEKAINQLIAHHSVIFKPEELKMWVSVNPYQLGRYLCYDLNMIFSGNVNPAENVFIPELTIYEDEFLYSEEFENFKKYKELTAKYKYLFSNNKYHEIDYEDIKYYKKLNPEFYFTYFLAGEYYRLNGDKKNALANYKIALSKEIPDFSAKVMLKSKIEKYLYKSDLFD